MSYNLRMSQNGSLKPLPKSVFDNKHNLISPSATNLNSTPMFYVGKRINTLWSSTNPNSFAIMKFGNNLHNVYGNLGNSHGTLYPVKVPNLNLTVDMKGNYKLVNDNGVSFKVNSDNLGNYVKYKNHKLYM